jgi:hypothetical protein
MKTNTSADQNKPSVLFVPFCGYLLLLIVLL